MSHIFVLQMQSYFILIFIRLFQWFREGLIWTRFNLPNLDPNTKYLRIANFQNELMYLGILGTLFFYNLTHFFFYQGNFFWTLIMSWTLLGPFFFFFVAPFVMNPRLGLQLFVHDVIFGSMFMIIKKTLNISSQATNAIIN